MIGLLDGPVFVNHPDLIEREHSRDSRSTVQQVCTSRLRLLTRNSCGRCFVRLERFGSASHMSELYSSGSPYFWRNKSGGRERPSATPQDLAQAILECIDTGARVLNLSAALAQPSTKSEPVLEEALAYAAKRGVIVVAAAGNQRTLGSTSITRHPWVIPVVPYDLQSRPMNYSVLGSSIGRHGLGAPGDGITSLGALGEPETLGGSSAATPFVTGAIALLWSIFPTATAAEVRSAVAQGNAPRRASVVPPLLNAWAAYQTMRSHSHAGRKDP